MSIWICPTHGLTGPMGCCPDASRTDLHDATPVVCAACGAPFAGGATLAEMEAEYAANFPVEHAAGVPMELVCARCYERGTEDAAA